MGLDYAWEKLFSGILNLASSDCPLRERLKGAFLAFQTLRPEEDFPEDLRNDYADIKESLTRVEVKGDEGKLSATLRTMTDMEASRVAEKIVSLYTKVARRYPDN